MENKESRSIREAQCGQQGFRRTSSQNSGIPATQQSSPFAATEELNPREEVIGQA
jgi:hypothetical protein